MKFYLLVIWGDLEIEKRGPFKDDTTRLRAARKIRRINGNDDGIHWLNLSSGGRVVVGDYSGRELGD
jgi:hypothetical protein